MLAVGPFDTWEDVISVVVAIAGSYWALLWLGAVVWTYRDIRERSTDSVSQAVAVILVLIFNIPGLILYLILRPHETLAEAYERNLEAQAILHEMGDLYACPSCRQRIEPDFSFCPHCRLKLREPCVKCEKPLGLSWLICPYCGTERPVAAARRTPSTEAAPAIFVTPSPSVPMSPGEPPSSEEPSPSGTAAERTPSGAPAKPEPLP